MQPKNKALLLLIPFLRVATKIQRWKKSISKKFFHIKKNDSLYDLGSWNNTSIVQTIYGKVRGTTDRHNTLCWKGIPYTKAPVDSLRWKAPLDPDPWQGTLKATKFGDSSAQLMDILGPMGSEDCLFLNIWRPNSLEDNLPVYVFIHGGGNSIGTSATADLYGHTVASRSNLVYVTMNYRLGVMGWFKHPAVTQTGTPEDQSGNFATLDLIKSLEWIQKNIVAFGGNPKNVTISGESAGAMNTLSLLISPKAHDLFHKAIIESGLSIIWSIAEAEEQSHKLLCYLLIKDKKCKTEEEATKLIASMSDTAIDAYLRSKSAIDLLKVLPSRDMGMADWKTIYADGVVIPVEGYKAFSMDKWSNKVPIIIGTNKDETKLFGFFRDDFKPGSEEYNALYKYRSLIWRVSGCDSVLTAISKNSNPPPVFAYRFDWGSVDSEGLSVLPGELGQHLGAHHYAEVPFFLGTKVSQLTLLIGKQYTIENEPGRNNLIDIIMKYLANFAKTGDPNDETLPEWKNWNVNQGKTNILVFNADYENTIISYTSETLTTTTIREMIESELSGKLKEIILTQLDDQVPFGLKESDLAP